MENRKKTHKLLSSNQYYHGLVAMMAASYIRPINSQSKMKEGLTFPAELMATGCFWGEDSHCLHFVLTDDFTMLLLVPNQWSYRLNSVAKERRMNKSNPKQK